MLLLAFLSKHCSIKSYLSVVRHLQISFGLSVPFTASMPRLEQVLKGIKVNQSCQGHILPNQKLPTTPRYYDS